MAIHNVPSGPSVRHMDTRSAYDAWSQVYDTDGNFLQALDTIEMRVLLPRMLSSMSTAKPWRIVDLGCGTGRNTVALLSTPDVEVVAVDLSSKMLAIAEEKLSEESQRLTASARVKFEVFDMLSTTTIPEAILDVDAIVSTLVVEHVPLDVFFRTATKMLRIEGLILITNMHSEMGNISQAGFIDPATGEKIRPTSFAHTVADLVAEAGVQGFQLLGQVDERKVDSRIMPKLGPRASKWIGVTVWFGGIFRKIS